DGGAFFHATDYSSVAPTEHPALVDLAMHVAQLMGFVQLALTILLLVLFFKRRSSVPLLMQVLYIGSLVWLLVDFWIYEAMDLGTVLGEPYGTKDIIRSFIVAVIWVPVFGLSERVRLTFTRQLRRVPGAPPPFREPPVGAEPPSVSM
ncbi:MAG TPA: DUF2569 family protein, partial [Flavobacteriales bacterium]|nr:DUF2569 family protein [Flavobacteriales bacterium]